MASASKRIRCTNCGKRFTLGARHQQVIERGDNFDACAECVGCNGCGEWPCIEQVTAGVACPPHPYGQEVTMRDYTVVVTETIQRVVHVRVRDGQTPTRERAKRYALEVIGRGNHNETRLVKSSVRIEETGSQNEIW